jgi:hypothetical protein
VSTPATLGEQDIDFAGYGGMLALLEPTRFYGEISDFESGDTIKLKDSWAFDALSHAGDMTTLTLHHHTTTHAFEFVGDYTRSEFEIHSGPVTTIKLISLSFYITGATPTPIMDRPGGLSAARPALFRNTTPIHPYNGNPGWNLITAMADDCLRVDSTLTACRRTTPTGSIGSSRRAQRQ